MFFPTKCQVPSSCIFYETSKSFAFVNLKPVLPGHVLVSPIRVVPLFEDLTLEEVSDLFQAAQKVERAVKSAFDGDSSTISVQNGPEAGQTVAHVHVHIIPRRKNDFENNDDIYSELEKHDKDGRAGRNLEDMEREAQMLRALF